MSRLVRGFWTIDFFLVVLGRLSHQNCTKSCNVCQYFRAKLHWKNQFIFLVLIEFKKPSGLYSGARNLPFGETAKRGKSHNKMAKVPIKGVFRVWPGQYRGG